MACSLQSATAPYRAAMRRPGSASSGKLSPSRFWSPTESFFESTLIPTTSAPAARIVL